MSMKTLLSVTIFRCNQTRPSALGMSDPICGPLIHNFVGETYGDKVDYENSVYFKNFENGVGK